MSPDIRTLLIGFAVNCFFVTIAFFFFQARQFRKDGVVEWSIAFFFQGIYWVLITFRGVIPDFLSIVVANILLTSNFCLLYLAACRLLHLPHKRSLLFLPPIFTFIFITFFWAYADRLFLRALYVTLVSGIQLGYIAWILFRQVPFHIRRSQWLTGSFSAVGAMIWFSFLLGIIISPPQKTELLPPTIVSSILIILAFGVVNLSSIGFLLMMRERTEEVLHEQKILLEDANKELEAFTYTVSHDLRAPLRAIDGFSKMLLSDAKSLGEDSKRKLKIVRENTEKMNRLIDDLLNLSRLGRQALKPNSLNMGKIFRESWDELCQSAPERKGDLHMGKLHAVSGDESLMKQVAANILSNAFKFTRDRKPAVIEINSALSDNEIVFSVKDNGVGFEMKFYDKLFGIFQRLHSEREYEGTGVGLTIVQRIIQRHGGQVWAEGKIGKGATFYFSLPAAK